ncbi:thioredoxin family protein [Allorhodopirellula solitaria]|uniref:Thioredoxin n=1 Tax=Allorhodopirellula solitaria TaxID=2527987 RepID=A0A5C5YI54_9BACT|nr:thioredoxin family protein [Allorhodopirellula solitaria]TWT74382.1 Thioredoxin [Allorhodopirellula solitaria]
MKPQLSPSHSFLIAATLLGFIALAGTGCEPPQSPQPAPAKTPAQFDTDIDSDKLVLVKFGATWCPPCREVDRELEALSGQLPADVEVLKIDVDESPELAQRYGISSIPVLMLVREGNILDDEIGYMSGDKIQDWIAMYRSADPTN